jgi:hypothetical protein
LNVGVEDVIWTDECKIEALGEPGKRLCAPGQHPGRHEEEAYPASIMVWGAISLSGKVFLKILTEHVTADSYCEVLKEFLKELEIASSESKPSYPSRTRTKVKPLLKASA